jgi:hypothetical protein
MTHADYLFEQFKKQKYQLIDEDYKKAVIDLVDYCRLKEKEKVDSKASIGGLDFLTSMIQEGLPLSLYFLLRPAVENYNDPYEINFKQ